MARSGLPPARGRSALAPAGVRTCAPRGAHTAREWRAPKYGGPFVICAKYETVRRLRCENVMPKTDARQTRRATETAELIVCTVETKNVVPEHLEH
ncbi:hypothetical protein EVAR_62653_1 [Eumeta japonica]|uniref:Uncharacterized protein n=1 Tax=Eumeta variegata TaxID=151549 RepID=A0A4C1Z515_EUMVA|nr:hypothetical protein EVAR_62653_1 [Eumeta japonica]